MGKRNRDLRHLLKAVNYRLMYSTLQDYPVVTRLLLGLILVAALIVLSESATGQSRYDSVFGYLLFAITLAWMGAAALAGAAAPVDNKVMRYAYLCLTTLIVVIFASQAVFRVQSLNFDTEPYWLNPTNAPYTLTLCFWMVLTGLVGALAPKEIDLKAYILLVIAPLLMGIGLLGYLHLVLGFELLPSVAGLSQDLSGSALLGSYWLAVFLLYRHLLSGPTWANRLRPNRLFIPVLVSTVVLTTSDLGIFLLLHGPADAAVAAFMILAPFGVFITRSRAQRVSVAALGIAMASYPASIIAALAGGLLIVGPGVWMMYAIPMVWAVFLSVPVGILIGRMRHPYRNVVVAAIGPGLVTMMIVYFYWIGVLH